MGGGHDFNISLMGKRKKKRDPDRPAVPAAEREKNTTVVVSLASHVQHKAVEAMVAVGNEAWDRVVCFGNDAVHSFARQRLQDKLEPPNLEDANFWASAFGYAIRRSNKENDSEMNKSFREHYDAAFEDHITLRPGFHGNFPESMATLEATANRITTRMKR